MSDPIYFDHNATTPVDPRVVQSMLPYFSDQFGNAASSTHAFGWEAGKALDDARKRVALCLGAQKPEQIIFTSGATEANNMLIKGLFFAKDDEPFHIVTQETEHSCVIKSIEFLKGLGAEVTVLPVDQEGFINLDDLKKSLKPHTKLVSIMWGNNEIGTLQAIQEIGDIVRNHSDALFHCDAVQAVSRVAIDLKNLPIDCLSFSAHKFYGPKGVGAMYLSERFFKTRWQPLLHGGGQEFGLRSTTVNIPGVIGMAKALELAQEDWQSEVARLSHLRNHLIDRVLNEIPHALLNGSRDKRLCHNASFCIPYTESGLLLLAMPQIACSSGSACASGKTEPSRVALAIGRSPEEARATIRFGLGKSNTKEQVDFAVECLKEACLKERKKSLAYEMLQQKKS
ncbi:MAG: cysteine desulfurase [Deltaproteobacteria bacterium]|nr:cysteine desulfurase [Deltaproteobacteria bacterium]